MKWKVGLFLALNTLVLVNSGIIKRHSDVPAKEPTDHEVNNTTGKAFERFIVNKLLMNKFLCERRFFCFWKLTISFQIREKILFLSSELIAVLQINTANLRFKATVLEDSAEKCLRF